MLQSSPFWDPHAPSWASLLWPPGVQVPPEAHPFLPGTSNLGTSDPWVTRRGVCCWGGVCWCLWAGFCPKFLLRTYCGPQETWEPSPCLFRTIGNWGLVSSLAKIPLFVWEKSKFFSTYRLASHMVSINHIWNMAIVRQWFLSTLPLNFLVTYLINQEFYISCQCFPVGLIYFHFT